MPQQSKVSDSLFAPSDKTPSEALAWVQSDNLWKRAHAIDGVEVAVDIGGREAKRFHAQTSGHTMLYDAQGNLVFYGGITAARGHEGDSDGKNAIIQALLGAEHHSPLSVASAISAVSGTVERQSEDLSAIVQSVEVIRHSTHESSAGIGQIAETAEDLSRMTLSLQELVQRFKISNGQESNKMLN